MTDPRILPYYERELQFLRGMGVEFSQEYPKIAQRLGLSEFECHDPYVERLLEGAAFLTARIQIKLDAEFPRFTQHLMEQVYPHYLPPVPSMAIAHMEPDLTEGSLDDGPVVPRHSVMIAEKGPLDQTACRYRTAHDHRLWPVRLERAEYVSSTGGVAALGISDIRGVKAAIRLVFSRTTDGAFGGLPLPHLRFFIRGAPQFAGRLFQQLQGQATAVVFRDAEGPTNRPTVRVDGAPVRPVGFEPDEALLPYAPSSFDGYRILQEYFAFPERFLFGDLTGFDRAAPVAQGKAVEAIILLTASDPVVENELEVGSLLLNAVPVVNLYPTRTQRLHISKSVFEHHLLVDRTHPLDYEIHSVQSINGYAAGVTRSQEFRPFFSLKPRDLSGRGAFFAVRREPRRLPADARQGGRSNYIGSELFVMLVDDEAVPVSHDLRQISAEVMVTNRDLPTRLVLGRGETDFTLEDSAPITSIRAVAGPTPPRAPYTQGDPTWRLVSHLSLNYLSLIDYGDDGASALRDMLMLYTHSGNTAMRRQIEGLHSVVAEPAVRRVGHGLKAAFARGQEIRLDFDEISYESGGLFLFGTVLERFFCKYASINGFTETVLAGVERGEVHRWPARPGQRKII